MIKVAEPDDTGAVVCVVLTPLHPSLFAAGAQALPSGSSQAKSKLVLRKHELDKAVKDKHHKLYSPSMRVELLFSSL
jgi:hypothetical protein